MSTTDNFDGGNYDERLEQLAEAVVFAHDETVTLPAESAEAREFEHMAAIAAAVFSRSDEVPSGLAARLSADALAFCAERTVTRPTLEHLSGGERERSELGTQAVESQAVQSKAANPPRAPGSPGAGKTGATSAVFTFLLGVAAVALVWIGVDMSAADAPPIDLLRTALIERSGTRTLEWQAGPSPLSGSVQGDVVWNDEAQEGYLTFAGLPPLDETRRFQLWIVDADRPDSDPVDGGLFSIEDSSRSEIVRIDPKIPIRKAAAFVVTVEDWDGVVVSKKQDVVAVAGL